MRAVENTMQSDGELNGSQVGGEVASVGADDRYQFLTNLGSQLRQLFSCQPF
jgi:hypothetical protein